MASTTPPADLDDLLALACAHGLELDRSTVRAACGAGADGTDGVLRSPRRPDVLARADIEGRLLALIAPQLDVAVPAWRVHSPELIAYPLLPGTPGLSIGADGDLTWHIDLA